MDQPKKSEHRIEVVYGDQFRSYGRLRRRVLDIRCTCGNTLSENGVRAFTYLSDTVLIRPALGLVRGYLMIAGSYDINDEYDDRLRCDKCDAELYTQDDPELEVDMSTADSPRDLERLHQRVRNGDSHRDCSCAETLLNEQGIRWVAPIEPEYVAPKTDPMRGGPDPEKQQAAQIQYHATPFIRGWFDAQMRLLMVCPHCDGSLLRKRAQSVIDGHKAAENLQRSA